MPLWLQILLPIILLVGGFLFGRLGKLLDTKTDKKNKKQDEIKSLTILVDALKAENSLLKDKSKIRESYNLSKNGTYYIHKITGERICTVCLDVDGNEVHIHEDTRTNYYLCPKCKYTGVTDEWRPEGKNIANKTIHEKS